MVGLAVVSVMGVLFSPKRVGPRCTAKGVGSDLKLSPRSPRVVAIVPHLEMLRPLPRSVGRRGRYEPREGGVCPCEDNRYPTSQAACM